MRIVFAVVLLLALWFYLTRAKGGATQGAGAGGGSSAPNALPNQDVLDSVSNEIATVEGFFKSNSLAQRTNNPGMVGGDNSRGFQDAGDGWDAVNGYILRTADSHPDWDFYDFMHNYVTGDTLGQGKPGFISPDAYAEQVAYAAGADPTQTVYSALYGGQG